MQKYLTILGRPVTDKVSRRAGVATTVSFDIAGCVRVFVDYPADKDGKHVDGRWHDHKMLDVTGKPVASQPDFAEPPGGRDLPAPR